MRTYVKVEGKDVEQIVQKLAKLAVDSSEFCVWDVNMYNMGWGYPDENPSAAYVGEMGAYLGMEPATFEKKCDKIIAKSGGDLGDDSIYFDWTTTPTDAQLMGLRRKIDAVLKPYGNKYTVTNRK